MLRGGESAPLLSPFGQTSSQIVGNPSSIECGGLGAAVSREGSHHDAMTGGEEIRRCSQARGSGFTPQFELAELERTPEGFRCGRHVELEGEKCWKAWRAALVTNESQGELRS